MVEELHRQLLQMHGFDSAPEPIDAAYMDWSRDPYGGGVHLWNVNYNSEEMLTRMTQPVENVPCYICGEAYSTNQTWAEGALAGWFLRIQSKIGSSLVRMLSGSRLAMPIMPIEFSIMSANPHLVDRDDGARYRRSPDSLLPPTSGRCRRRQ
jgi:hypothetical protein